MLGYSVAAIVYPVILIGTLMIGMLGILIDRQGTRRVGMVMIGCQLVMLVLGTAFHMPQYEMESTAIINALCAVPLLMRPPAPARVQRFAAGLFIASGMLTGMFSLAPKTPFMQMWWWFTTAGIDAAMLFMLGGLCCGLIGKDIAAYLRHHAGDPSRSGHSR